MTRFCLIRHGQTDWNRDGRYQGQSDIPLNEHGRKQAEHVALQLVGEQIDLIVCSDLKRAKETAEIIASSLNTPLVSDSRLREINQGEWEGKRPAEIKFQYLLYHLGLFFGSDNLRIPGGETIREVADRMEDCLNEFVKSHPEQNLAVVSHGLALATVICMSKGIQIRKAFMHIPGNGHPIWLEWPPIGTRK